MTHFVKGKNSLWGTTNRSVGSFREVMYAGCCKGALFVIIHNSDSGIFVKIARLHGLSAALCPIYVFQQMQPSSTSVCCVAVYMCACRLMST